ncbi:MAG: S8 family serine peptidase [Proteobacteria bacterium]|nr:S8 family serine peptidase [Pseudomonadota bacterium]
MGSGLLDPDHAEFNSQQGFSFVGTNLVYRGRDHNAVYLHGFHHAYARGYTGNGSVIAVADSGVWLDHPDLNTPGKIKAWKNFLSSNTSMTPRESMREMSYHGTMIAGIIAGERDGGRNNEDRTVPVSGTMTTVDRPFNMHGVAYDAQLAMLKIGVAREANTRLLEGEDGGYAWARQQNATAITHSFGPVRDQRAMDFENSLIQVGNDPGNWLPNSSNNNNNILGYNRAADRAKQAAMHAGDQMIFVLAAGNDRNLSYSYGVTQMATATDKSINGTNKLILGGRAIVVGWWDTATNTTYGNQAGNICTTVENRRCIDQAKIQDFCILAEGGHLGTWKPGDQDFQGDYRIRAGSSYAVPVVAGAVAIIHQMWPHMKGKNIVRLLLDTARTEGISNYTEHVHGQGLLDMEKATRPFGVVGIPVTGRMPTNTTRTRLLDTTGNDPVDAGWDDDAGYDAGYGTGGRIALRGGASLTSPPSPKALAAGLGEVMVLDDFDRDFYFDLTGAVSYTSPSFVGVSGGGAGAGSGGGGYIAVPSPYAGYFAPGQHVQFQPIALGGRYGAGAARAEAGDAGVGSDDDYIGMLAVAEAEEAKAVKSYLQFGLGTSYDHVLGNRFSGILGTSRHSHTLYGLYNYNYGEAGAGVGLYGQLGVGVSYTEFDQAGSLLDEAELMVSSTAVLGYGFGLGEAGWWGVRASQPIVLERARLRYDVPVGLGEGGAVVREARVVDFRADEGRRLVDVAAEVGLDVGAGRLSAYGEVRTRGADFGDGGNERRVGVRFGRVF